MKKVGDWNKALSITVGMTDKFRKSVRQAMLQEAHFLRGHMVKGITSGAPGGQAFKPLSPLTLALRRAEGARGTKPLIRTGNLRRSISVVDVGGPLVGGRVFVGVHRSAKTKDGKGLVKLAEVHEFGAEISREKSRRVIAYLMARLREKGVKLPELTSGGKGDGRIRIPARPFVRPVVETYAQPEDVKRRFYARLAKGMGYQIGRP